MKIFRNKTKLISLSLIISIIISSCGLFGAFTNSLDNPDPTALPTTTPTPIPTLGAETRGALETIQSGFSGVYAQVLPSVVNISVVQTVEQGAIPDTGELPFGFPFQFPENSGQFYRSGLGSGFVWDKDGHIVTNNHVVEGADEITVTFHDGTSVDGVVVGADRDSDLAVVKIEYPEDELHPIQVTDSTQVQVGQLMAAIGNPFGLQGTMTIGIVSALGRSLPVGANRLQGTYTIPDVIQTDAPINPGNSGGVLVDMNARLVGVPTAIESSSGVNAGIGFVVPSVIVQKVVPVLIEQGFYEHPWIGISGTTLNSDMAEEMNLSRDQRGILVADVVPDSPADTAGLISTSADSQDGDVIIQIESQPTQDFEDLTSYLARYTIAGQTVTLTVLRDGEQETLELTLGVRPTTPQPEQRQEIGKQGGAWLGISGLTISPEIADEMDLPSDQTGVLIQEVIEKSPADQAGLRGSSILRIIHGEQVFIGGDVIVALDDKGIGDMAGLKTEIRKHESGDEVVISVIRDRETIDVRITLGTNN
jgi:S1-C subfamily serine protease